MMPNFVSTMSRRQIGSIVEYIKTLESDQAENMVEPVADEPVEAEVIEPTDEAQIEDMPKVIDDVTEDETPAM
jgi:hypothetical protein